MPLSNSIRWMPLLAVIAVGSISAQEITGEVEELSYKMGYDIGQRMRDLGIQDFDSNAFRLGAEDAMAEGESRLTEEQVQNALATLKRIQDEEMTRKREELAQAASNNMKIGQDYLEDNKARDGVTVTESGLQYEVVEMAEGPRPVATDTVKVHYRGTLIDGTEFDSSYSRGQPAVFPLNRVISGWTEGLQLMPVGSKFRFVIPSDLAYGGRNQGNIGPNSTLVFDVELLSIEQQ
ncbi:MAG: FKBP-type peptidyl-prolyl cis-trans isomerase [Xanthomonadales bacterium]|nr:FKBP-type peptidyl-prolyl cis-trans isomerase [Xanthomonadales bacterium]